MLSPAWPAGTGSPILNSNMHFLICIGGEQYSQNTLSFGISLASALSADLSILYVRPQLSSQFRTETEIAREKLAFWELETPEVRVIRAVEKTLLQEGFLRTVEGKVDVRHLPKPGIRGAYEYHVYGTEGENVRIRVREGHVVDSILRETTEIPYDLVIVGAPGDGGRLVRFIIHYVETSVLIAKKTESLDGPRLLLCVDDSPAARKAGEFCVRAARLLETSVDILSIYSYPWEEHAALNAAELMQRLLKRFEVPFTTRICRGPVVKTILEQEESGQIVVMGNSRRPTMLQFFLESTPVKIGRRGQNSVLVVK